MDEQRDATTALRRRQRATSSRDRGQTTLDFAIGMSLFLAVLIFIFLFIPGLLAPFTSGGQEETVSTNRVADYLAKDALGSPAEPFVLDEYCTVEFFEGNSPSQCNYGGGSLDQQLGLQPDRQNANVTIRGNASTTTTTDEVLCWDDTNERLVEDGNGDCSVTLMRGDAPPESNDATVTALRVASLHGQDVTIYVEMW